MVLNNNYDVRVKLETSAVLYVEFDLDLVSGSTNTAGEGG